MDWRHVSVSGQNKGQKAVGTGYLPHSSTFQEHATVEMSSTIPDSVTKGDPNDKLVICGVAQFGNTAGSGSPYTCKIETYCRMTGIPYEVEIVRSMKGSPKGMVPYIRHGEVVLADSSFILEYLANTYPDLSVQEPKDGRARGTAVAAQCMCEEHLVLGMSYFFWIHPKGQEWVQSSFFGGAAGIMAWWSFGRMKNKFYDKLYKQGFARHSEGDVCKLLDRDLEALSLIVGDNKYLIGQKVCKEDAIVFATLDVYLNSNIEGLPLEGLVRQYPNLVTYVDNMRAAYYGEEPSKFRRE